MKLRWMNPKGGPEATLGDFKEGDGVRFSLHHMPSNYRRGPWRLLIEVQDCRHTWGCFDDQDQPVRFYHSLERAQAEAQAIADVLLTEHDRKMERLA